MNLSLMDTVLEATRLLESRAVPSPRLEAEVLLAHGLGIERIDLYKSPERSLTQAEIRRYKDLIEQRASGVPTAYLRGKKEFFSRMFKVGPGVLIPRAETELLVEETIRSAREQTSPEILELGVGSGAVIISILLNLPQARGTATDTSSKALEYAAENAKINGVLSRIKFLQGDLFEPLPHPTRFDLIISNPPYVPTAEITEALRFEPRKALDGGPDGLTYYRKILTEAPRFLNPKGSLILEIGSTNKSLLDQELTKHKNLYSPPLFKKDLAGHDRILILAFENRPN